jgi:hypothetical protein
VAFSQAALQKWAVYQKLCSNLTGRPPAEIDVICRTTGMAHGQGTIGSFGACHDRYPSAIDLALIGRTVKIDFAHGGKPRTCPAQNHLPTKRRRLPET